MVTRELVFHTDDPDETRRLAAALAPLLRAGDVVALSGELGAGKTCFVQGAARALGVERRVTSPTFVLVRHYDEASPPIVHCDVYRLDRLQEVVELGDEVLAPDVVTFLEWGDAVASLLPEDRLEVEVRLADDADGGDAATGPAGEPSHVSPGEGGGLPPADPEDAVAEPGRRRVAVRARGAWIDRLPELADACAPWRGNGSR